MASMNSTPQNPMPLRKPKKNPQNKNNNKFLNTRDIMPELTGKFVVLSNWFTGREAACGPINQHGFPVSSGIHKLRSGAERLVNH